MHWLYKMFYCLYSRQRSSQPDSGSSQEETKQSVIPGEWARDYLKLWETVEIRKEHQGTVEWYVKRIKRYKPRYERVERRTGVPWFVVACIHGLECGFDWGAALHNGDKIIGTGEKTTRVPAGRGPFATWEEAAEDALKYDKATEVPVWDVVNTLYFLELFNGTGYRKYHPEVKSPYLWGMTNHHSKGKYVSDGKFDSEAITKQAGAAAILKLLNAFA